jgi:protein-S-isoprenylcysteine O-methyltransferase Ste14
MTFHSKHCRVTFAGCLGRCAVTISFMEAMLLRITWLLGIGYSSIPLFWLAIHPFAATWRRLHWSPYRALLPLWALVIAAEAWLTWPWRASRLYSTPWMWLASLPFFFLGWRTYRRIFAEFGGRNLSGASEIIGDVETGRLVNTGMHAHMRHPIYLAHLCNFAGLAIGSGLTVNFILLAISLIVTYPLMIAVEERELVKRFGEPYRLYQSEVPALPFLELRKPDPRQSATRLLELPPDSARVEAKDDYNARLVPSNAEAASIWCRGASGQYIVGAGAGRYHEHFAQPEEVLSFCRWVTAGNLEETIWTKGGTVVASTGSGGNNTFLLWGFNPFRKKTVATRTYAPYTGSRGTNG